MTRGLIRSLVVMAAVALMLTELRAREREASPHAVSPVLERFLALGDPSPTNFRALRHLQAHNDHFDSTAWMDVWTDADEAKGFRFTVAASGGSDYIIDHVFVPALETE